MPKPASFELSADTRLLLQRLKKVPMGETITYDALTAEIGKKVSGATPALQSARRVLMRDDQTVFSPIRGVGLQRLNDEAIVSATEANRDAIRRKAKKAAREVTCVQDYNALPPAKQLRHTAALSVFTAIAEMASDRGVKRVETAAHGRSGELPISQTLAAFAEG